MVRGAIPGEAGRRVRAAGADTGCGAIEEHRRTARRRSSAVTRHLLPARSRTTSRRTGVVWRAPGSSAIRRLEAAGVGGRGRAGDVSALGAVRHRWSARPRYRSASPTDRQDVHRALARSPDPDDDQDPPGCTGPRPRKVLWYEQVRRAELERSARRARRAGGLAAEAAFWSVRHTLSPERGESQGAALLAAAGRNVDDGRR